MSPGCLEEFGKVVVCPRWVEGGTCRHILRAWLDEVEPSWQCRVLVYSWNHFSNLSLTVLRDGLSIILQL